MIRSKIEIKIFAKRSHLVLMGGKGLNKFVNSHFLLIHYLPNYFFRRFSGHSLR